MSVSERILVMTNSQAWGYAIGMIKVDGLEPTEDFKKYIEKEKRGEVTMEDAKLFLDKKYKINTGRMRNFLLANSYQLCYHL